MKYEIIDNDSDKGLHLLKLENGLLLSLYNVGYANGNLYYKYDILNSDIDTNFNKIDKDIKKIIKKLYFEEELWKLLL